MTIKVKLTITGSNPPNRTRSLIDPKTIEFEVPEEQVEKVVKRLEKYIQTLDDLKKWLKV